MMWICSGTPSGESPPKSAAGMAAYRNTCAPFAPGRVWASICAGITPSDMPAYTTSFGTLYGGEAAALEDRVEAGLPRVANAGLEVGKRLSLVEIRCVHDVAGGAELVSERTDPSVRPSAW